MDEGQGAAQKPGRGRSLERGVVQTYVRTAAALAIARVSVLAWVEYRTVSDRMTATVDDLFWFCARNYFWASTLASARLISRVLGCTSYSGRRS